MICPKTTCVHEYYYVDTAEGVGKREAVHAGFPPEQLSVISLKSGNHTVTLNEAQRSLLKRTRLKNVCCGIHRILIRNYCVLLNLSAISLSFKFQTAVFCITVFRI